MIFSISHSPCASLAVKGMWFDTNLFSSPVRNRDVLSSDNILNNILLCMTCVHKPPRYKHIVPHRFYKIRDIADVCHDVAGDGPAVYRVDPPAFGE